MTKQLNNYKKFFEDYKELQHYLSWLGYTNEEIKLAIDYYNLHHLHSMVELQTPLAVGRCVEILINELNINPNKKGA